MAEYVEKYVDYVDAAVAKASDTIRDSLSSSPWIPDMIRPQKPPPPPKAVALPSSTYERVQDWVSRHKVLTGLIVLTTGTVLYRSYKKSRYCRRTRRAKRAKYGRRVEVVVIAGSPTLPLTRSLSLDMERRGFIVFVVCGGVEDEILVQNLSRHDIRPLTVDITDVSTPSPQAFAIRKLNAEMYSLPMQESLSSGSRISSRSVVRRALVQNLTISC